MNRILSIVVPVYNEEEVIEYSFKRLIKLKEMTKNSIAKVEILFIDDGSKDKSFEILSRLKKSTSSNENIYIKIIKFSRNFGHSSAVLAGLENASGDLIAFIDADLQDPPELIPEMIDKIDHGWDVVYGCRNRRKGETVFKKLSAWIFYRILTFLSGVEIPKDSGDFRIITREVSKAVQLCREQEPFLRGIVAWVGFKQTAFFYNRDERCFGTTKYPFFKMLRFAINAIISFSSMPLRLAAYIGMTGLTFTLLLGGYAIYAKIQGNTVPGWASLLASYTLGQSVTLIVVGLIGIYIGRVHRELQGRPRYIIRTSKESV